MSKTRPIILADWEAAAMAAGTLTAILRPAHGMISIDKDGVARGSRGTKMTVMADWVGPVVECPFATAGNVIYGREAFTSWESNCVDDNADYAHECEPHCHQVYVAYRATPRVGYRPVPDKAKITFLHESTPLERNSHLVGPWEKAAKMPEWASRIHRVVDRVTAVDLQDMTPAEVCATGAILCAEQVPPERFQWSIKFKPVSAGSTS